MQIGSEVPRRGQGAGVVVAEHPAVAGQGVLIQLAGRLILAQVRQIEGEGGRRAQGVACAFWFAREVRV